MDSIFYIDLESLIENIDAETNLEIEEIKFAANTIYKNSQLNVPVETGKLLESGSISIFLDCAIISYETPYASYVHEIKDNFHKVGKEKYLEDSVIAYIANTKSNLSYKISLTKRGVYLYISTKKKSIKFNGFELNYIKNH